jgi:hypothetical protein
MPSPLASRRTWAWVAKRKTQQITDRVWVPSSPSVTPDTERHVHGDASPKTRTSNSFAQGQTHGVVRHVWSDVANQIQAGLPKPRSGPSPGPGSAAKGTLHEVHWDGRLSGAQQQGFFRALGGT